MEALLDKGLGASQRFLGQTLGGSGLGWQHHGEEAEGIAKGGVCVCALTHTCMSHESLEVSMWPQYPGLPWKLPSLISSMPISEARPRTWKGLDLGPKYHLSSPNLFSWLCIAPKGTAVSAGPIPLQAGYSQRADLPGSELCILRGSTLLRSKVAHSGARAQALCLSTYAGGFTKRPWSPGWALRFVPAMSLPSVCLQVPGPGPAVHISGLTAPALRLHPRPGPQATALLPQLHRDHAQRGRGCEAGHPGVPAPVSGPPLELHHHR